MKLAAFFLIPFLLGSAPPDRLTTLLDEMERLTLAGDQAAVGRLVPAVLEDLAKPHMMATIAWNQVGVYFQTQGKFLEAERAYQRGIRLCEKEAVGGLEILLLNLAGLYLQAGQRPAHAEVVCRRALKQAIEVYGPGSPELADFHYMLGAARQQQGDRADARRFFQQALDLADDRSEGKYSQGLIRGHLAHLSILDKQWIQARDSLLQSIALMESSGLLYPDLVMVRTYLHLARAYEGLKQWTLASASVARARQITETRLSPDHPLMAEILRACASILRKTGHGSEARDLSRRAAAIAKAQPQDFAWQARVHIADLKQPTLR